MPTLKQIAATYGLYQSEDLPKEFKEIWDTKFSDYNKKTHIEIPDFFINNPDYEAGVFFQCITYKESDGQVRKYFGDCNVTLVKQKTKNIICSLHLSNRYVRVKYYTFHLYYGISSQLQNKISRSFYDSIKASFDTLKPNKIGTFTDIKVGNWFNYLNLLYYALKEKVEDLEKENIAQRGKIKEFIDSLKGVDGKITSRDNKEQEFTHIKTPKFEVEFRLDILSGYLSHKIEYKGNLEDVANIEKALKK